MHEFILMIKNIRAFVAFMQIILLKKLLKIGAIYPISTPFSTCTSGVTNTNFPSALLVKSNIP